KLHRFENPDHVADPAVVALAAMLRDGFDGMSSEALAGLLGHVDRRARRGAQHALAARGDARTLGRVATDEGASLLARVHALWGLGQLGADGLRRAGIDDLEFTQNADPELRAQALRIAGEARAAWLEPELTRALGDEEPARIQSMAAKSLGKLQATDAISDIIDLLRRNDDSDVYLRLAAVHALELMDDIDAVLAYASDPAPAVRRAVVLVLRRGEDVRLANFLYDPDPSIVVEAARAIHDLYLVEVFAALAGLGAEGGLSTDDDDLQSTGALHRRVIGANLALGGADNATAIARYAANASRPVSMRHEALESLAHFTRPEPRERVFGFYRGWSARPPESVHAALDLVVPALIDTPLEARALEIALANGRVPLPDADLLTRIEGWFVDENVKVASLRILGERRSPALDRALSTALDSRSELLRAEARDVLAATRPDDALAEIVRLSSSAPLVERQRAYGTLATIGNEAADAELRDAIAALDKGELDAAVALDALSAARRRGETLGAELAAYDAAHPPGDPIAPRRVTRAGGDAARGRLVFDGIGGCQRCHSVEGAQDGRAGPNLLGVGSRSSADHLLESVLVPQAAITPGFGSVGVVLWNGETVSGILVAEDDESLTLDIKGDERRVARGDIASRTEPASGMPPMGLALSLADLRDLIAYLHTL
ncbi:MAG: HEAT repeat domain-containing protein, partial [Myxococcales bacterium]|nr:HEAT repeat domain-containing protein [Myxococcales bacterium]